MPNDTFIYDTPILYSQHMDDESQNKFKDFYSSVFSKYKITTIHDCSIGAGGSTLPLAKLGYSVSGSDMDKYWLSSDTEKEKKGDFEKDFKKIQWYGILAQKIE